MKILHLNDKTAILGGVEVYVEQLQQLLPATGAESVWMGISKNEQTYSMQIYPSEKVSALGDLAATGDFLRQWADRENIDLINIHSISDPDLISLCFAIRPVVRSLHEPRMFCPGQGKFWRFSEKVCNQPFGIHCLWHTYTQGCSNRHPVRLKHAMENTWFELNTAAPAYQKIVVMSRYMKDECIKAGIAEEKVGIIPYFTLYRDRMAPTDYSGPKRLLFMGRFISHKGIHLMLQALRPLLEQYPDLYLDMVGDGEYYPKLQQEIEQLKTAKVAERVVFHGWQNRRQVEAFLTNCYAVIFPSIYPEAFGIVGIEAMMYGKPVVGFDTGGVNSWLNDGVTGFCVPTGDTAAMQNSVQKLIDSPELHREFALAARQTAVEKFVPEIHIRQLSSVYQSAI
ncbi:MAG: glycosyltransferase family 4 protein [Bacteroidia bacterium]